MGMQFAEALSQISEIHGHLAKGEVYRGFRPFPVALSGACGLAAIGLQGRFVAADDPIGVVVFWLSVAVIGGFVGGSETLYKYVFHEDAFTRRRTRRVVGQFVPCLVAGSAVTAALTRSGGSLVPLLPGLWAILFGLGL